VGWGKIHFKLDEEKYLIFCFLYKLKIDDNLNV